MTETLKDNNLSLKESALNLFSQESILFIGMDEQSIARFKKVFLSNIERLENLEINDLSEIFSIFFKDLISGTARLIIKEKADDPGSVYVKGHKDNESLFDFINTHKKMENPAEVIVTFDGSKLDDNDISFMDLVHEVAGHYWGWKNNEFLDDLTDEEVRAIIKTAIWHTFIMEKDPDFKHPLYDSFFAYIQHKDFDPVKFKAAIRGMVEKVWGY